jgi:hypothetical protein
MKEEVERRSKSAFLDEMDRAIAEGSQLVDRGELSAGQLQSVRAIRAMVASFPGDEFELVRAHGTPSELLTSRSDGQAETASVFERDADELERRGQHSLAKSDRQWAALARGEKADPTLSGRFGFVSVSYRPVPPKKPT